MQQNNSLRSFCVLQRKEKKEKHQTLLTRPYLLPKYYFATKNRPRLTLHVSWFAEMSAKGKELVISSL